MQRQTTSSAATRARSCAIFTVGFAMLGGTSCASLPALDPDGTHARDENPEPQSVALRDTSTSASAVASTPTSCTAAQFVACPTGEACASRKGVLVTPRPCFDRARDACADLQCQTGCDIYDGSPKQIHCAINASSTGHMKVCGGYSGWQCPEDMRCEMPADAIRFDDASGRCVPN